VFVKGAQIETTRSQIASLKTAIKTFDLEVGRLPRTLDELVIEGGEDWPGPFLDEEEVPKDGWKNDFRYEQTGKGINVYSAGLDGEFGTDDDIYR
jgi:hypothetical protein